MKKKNTYRYVNCSTGEMADTPYGADRLTRTIYTNPILAAKLTAFEKKFWLLHEKGHIELDTNDELLADAYAFNHLAGTQFRSLKQMIEACENLLDSNIPYHQERIDNIYRLALQWDKNHPINKAVSTDNLREMRIGMNDQLLNVYTGILGVMDATNETQNNTSNNNMLQTLLLVGAALIAIKLLK